MSQPSSACAAEDHVYIDHLDRIARDFPHVGIGRYGETFIAGTELQTVALSDTVHASVA